MKDFALIIFYKNPVRGNVKTRLAATIGDRKALEIYEQLTFITEYVTKNVNADRFVFYSDFVAANDHWSHCEKYLQMGDNLGERMANATRHIFSRGYQQVVIIGTDCPEISEKFIHDAAAALVSHDVVIGPAADGGYYLIGSRMFVPSLFQDIPWSTSNVLPLTLDVCRKHQLNVFQLPMLHDVDDEKDLVHIDRVLCNKKN